MNKPHNFLAYNFAKFLVSFFTLALCVCANTNSSIMVHQPKHPKSIDRYKI